MKREEFEKLILRHNDGNFYPSFVLEDGEYTVTKEYTAEEAYARWLEDKEKQAQKSQPSKSPEELTKENQQLWETVEYLLKQVDMIPKEG